VETLEDLALGAMFRQITACLDMYMLPDDLQEQLSAMVASQNDILLKKCTPLSTNANVWISKPSSERPYFLSLATGESAWGLPAGGVIGEEKVPGLARPKTTPPPANTVLPVAAMKRTSMNLPLTSRLVDSNEPVGPPSAESKSLTVPVAGASKGVSVANSPTKTVVISPPALVATGSLTGPNGKQLANAPPAATINSPLALVATGSLNGKQLTNAPPAATIGTKPPTAVAATQPPAAASPQKVKKGGPPEFDPNADYSNFDEFGSGGKKKSKKK